MPKTCLMMVAGERSGDVYGARLATALEQRLPEIEIFGCGGDAMRHAGVETVADARWFAMVGITEVVSGLPRAYRAFHALLDVAHPLVDTVEASLTRETFFAQAGLDPDAPTVALLPGSREIEVSLILPTMLRAAAQLARARPVQFVIAVAPTLDPGRLERELLK